ncbi:MAG: nitronate monooxygenase [Thermodesulfobacteriota bacterium]|nr:nitronate monooxygenase [Thermodesulfobacteriota bacterium]
MFKTKLCEMLKIEYPIIQGGMVWISLHELCAAVSEAGGLGMLAGGGLSPEELREEIRLVRERTKKPFGVNIPLIRPDIKELITVSIEEKADVIATSAGSPKGVAQAIHEAGLKVIHVSPSATLAAKAATAGVDAVVAEGIEAGGHESFDEIATMALIPQVVDKVDIPVIAAGGMADSRGFVAGLALGAQGIQMGTRFIATHEAKAHPKFKQAVLDLVDNGTVITGRSIGPIRCIKNKLSARIIEAEKRGAGKEELLDLIGEGRSRLASEQGDLEEGTLYCGQIGGLISDLKSVAEVITEIIAGAEVLVKNLGELSKK